MKKYNKIEIRPEIQGINDGLNKTVEESFQNETLRPILKLQHDLLVVYFKAYTDTKKIKFDSMSNLKKIEFVQNIFKKDNAFKNELKGLVIGHFTIEEYAIYTKYKNDFNKRLLRMAQQRIASVFCND